MKLRLNLVVKVLLLTSFIIIINSESHQRASDDMEINGRASTVESPKEISVKNYQPVTSVITSSRAIGLKPQINSTGSSRQFFDFKSVLERLDDSALRGNRGKKDRKWTRNLTALLMAYKLKFAVLVPTIIGGLILLLSTTAMAGFFFALFAAILGMKGT